MGSYNTLDAEGLQALLHRIGIDSPIPTFPSVTPFPLHNPIDLYRLYLTQAAKQVVDCDPSKVYDGFQRPTNPGKGDLSLVTARLGMRGKKPDELAAEIASKVRIS